MTIPNLAQFNRQLNAFLKSVPRDHAAPIVKKIAFEALRRVVLRTPVRTGRARGGWQTTVNVQPAGETGRLDKSGELTIAEGISALSAVKGFDVVYITNNVPYIGELEEGSSTQAPTGMVKVTIEELRGMFQ